MLFRSTLAIRHEAVSLTRNVTDRANHLAGRIEHVHYLGAQVNIDIRCGERQLTAIAPSGGADWSAGDSVFVCWPAEAGWVFNATGQRL